MVSYTHETPMSELKSGIIGNVPDAITYLINRVTNTCNSLGYRCLDSDELISRTIMSVYESIDSYDPSRSFNTWIRKIATNNAIDVYRRSKSRIKTLYQFQEPKGTTSFEDRIMQGESYERTLHEISKLSRGDNEIINLRMKGLSYKQIGRELQLPMGTVKGRLHTIRKSLEEKLRDN